MSVPKKSLFNQPPSSKTSASSPVRNSAAERLGDVAKPTKVGPGQSRFNLARNVVDQYMRSQANSGTTARPSLLGKLGGFLEKLIKRP